jgi:hypothetical protein
MIQAVKIIEDYNKIHSIIKNIKIPHQIEQEQIKIEHEQVKITQNLKKVEKGKILGKLENNDNVFLNHSAFNDKFYLRTSKSKENITIPIHYDVKTLTINEAKNIIDFHNKYNDKVVGTLGNHEVILKNGYYSLYIKYNNKLYSIPNYMLNDIDSFNLDKANDIIVYQTQNKEIPIIKDNIETPIIKANIEIPIIKPKKSFLQAVKNNQII